MNFSAAFNAIRLAGGPCLSNNSQHLMNNCEHIDAMQQPLDWANLLFPRGVATGTRRTDQRLDSVEKCELKMHGFMYEGLGNSEVRALSRSAPVLTQR